MSALAFPADFTDDTEFTTAALERYLSDHGYPAGLAMSDLTVPQMREVLREAQILKFEAWRK